VTPHPQALPARTISLSNDDYPGKLIRNTPTSRAHAHNNITSSTQATRPQADPHNGNRRQHSGPIYSSDRNTEPQSTTASGEEAAGRQNLNRETYPQDSSITSSQRVSTNKTKISLGYRHQETGKHDCDTALNQRLSIDTTDENTLLSHDSSLSHETIESSPTEAHQIEIQDFSPYDTTYEDELPLDSSDRSGDDIQSWKKSFDPNRKGIHTPVTKEVGVVPTQDRAQRSRQQKLFSIDPDNNQAYGDVMHQNQTGLSRFYFINPNGISHHRGFLDFYEILQSLKDNEIDVFGFSETNLDVRQPEVRKQIEEITPAFYGTSLLASSRSKISSHTPYKPGGTITGISNELCGRFQTSGSDKSGLGRWLYIQLYGKHGRLLVIITAYRVCEGKISTSGASTAYHQQ
jgi:hypothetical protein